MTTPAAPRSRPARSRPTSPTRTPGRRSRAASLTFGLNAETDGWDPTSNRWSSSGYIVGFSIFDPLAVFGADLKAHPYLAKSFESNADFTEWVIGVRDGVTFHDGTPVDADAILASLKKQQESLLTGATMDFVDTFEAAPDGQSIIVKMNKPWSTFPETLTGQAGVIAAPSMLADPEGNKNPVGSGPFTFESWEQGSNLKVAKNADYWREGYPYLDDIEFRVVSDISARGTALELGRRRHLRDQRRQPDHRVHRQGQEQPRRGADLHRPER